MIKDFEKYDVVRKRLPIRIGKYWEHVCLQIVNTHFNNNENKVIFQAKMINNTIADIIIGKNIKVRNKKFLYADIVVECKKSTYFGEIDVLNNETTEKYINYCDSLQYWILEKPENFEYPNYSKVKYLFWEDICQIYDVDLKIQENINQLSDFMRFVDNVKDLEAKDLETLISIYQKFENLDLTSIEYFLDIKKLKKTSSVKTETVIRKYQANGIFIQEYDSIQLASQHNDISINNISEVIAKRRKTTGGFLWQKHIKASCIL